MKTQTQTEQQVKPKLFNLQDARERVIKSIETTENKFNSNGKFKFKLELDENGELVKTNDKEVLANSLLLSKEIAEVENEISGFIDLDTIKSEISGLDKDTAVGLALRRKYLKSLKNAYKTLKGF